MLHYSEFLLYSQNGISTYLLESANVSIGWPANFSILYLKSKESVNSGGNSIFQYKLSACMEPELILGEMSIMPIKYYRYRHQRTYSEILNRNLATSSNSSSTSRSNLDLHMRNYKVNSHRQSYYRFMVLRFTHVFALT